MIREAAGYQMLYQERLSDAAGQGMVFVHKQSGARICVISNEDVQKVFQIAFRTIPEDSTGVAHIVEHAVFCGSEKFPVKDVFAECEKGSVKTFLNAMTYPDKTVYPVASCNDRDFQNLMELYLDSVFHPLLLEKEEIFLQEGWRYELAEQDAPLELNGIVYNEMQGAYTSPEAVLYREAEKVLYEGSSYAHDSGGSCEEIPNLTYEACLEFYRKHYHPSNSYIYLYGDLDYRETLEWLDRTYLCYYSRKETENGLHTVLAEGGLQRIEIPYPAEEDEEQSACLLQILTGSPLDVKTCTALEILAEVLVESSGAPVKQALLDAQVGLSVSGEFHCETLQPSFSIEVQDCLPGKRDVFYEIVKETLTRLVKGGLDKNSLLATINSQEFSLREAEYEHPKGVEYGVLVLNSWLYDDNAAFLWLNRLEIYKELRELVKTDYFEQLIQQRLLNIERGVLAELVPVAGLLEQKQEQAEKNLEDYKAALSEHELTVLIEKNKQLQAYQEEPDLPEHLAKMPCLTLKDINRQGKRLYNQEFSVAGDPLVWHSIPSNGILYFKCHFLLPELSKEELHRLGLLLAVLGGLDTQAYTYGELSVLARMYTGGISFYAETFASKEGPDVYTPVLAAEVRVLEGNLAEGLKLVQEILLHSRFGDLKRLKELVLQTLSQMKNDILYDSGYYARKRAMSYYAVQEQFMEQVNGLSFYEYIRTFSTASEERWEQLAVELQAVLGRILTEGTRIYDLTAEQKGLEEALVQVPVFSGKLKCVYECGEESIGQVSGAGIENSYDSLLQNCKLQEMGLEKNAKAEKVVQTRDSAYTNKDIRGHLYNEAFILPGNLQYTAMCGSFLNAGYPFSGVLDVVKNLLNTDYLYQEIRMKGGAYGYGYRLYTVSGHMVFFSDDDPNLEETYEAYEKASDYLEQLDLSQEELEKYIIGTIGQEDYPLGAKQWGEQSFNAYMNGFDEEKIQREREEIFSVTLEQLRKAGALVRAVTKQGYCCVLGSRKKIREAEARFSVVRKLQV